MALKFLNKKGWHTGSLRNIENVWKAEQKHDAEQKKLEELRKQIQEERERSEFRLLQEKAGLVPKQERLEFLYDSGLSVGRTENSEGFKALEAFPKPDAADAPSSSASASKQPSAPGALFEDKPQSANDAWRKLHSDPLLMIRQREQEALARIKNNPIKMAMIQKSEKDRDKKKHRKKHRHSSSKHHRNSSPRQQSDSEDDTVERRKRKTDKRIHSDSESDSMEGERKIKKKHDENKKYKERPPRHHSMQDTDDRYYSKKHDDDKNYKERSPRHLSRQDTDDRYWQDTDDRYYSKSKSERYASEGQSNGDDLKRGRDSERENRSFPDASSNRSSHYKHRNTAPKLTDEERAAKLKQMQLAAELHEEQRWKRLKNAEENDAKEAIIQSSSSGGRNFLDAAQKSVYGAAEGGSSSIAESVRRRTHYSQGRSEAGEGNAFRR
ncbi:pre-mRNA-splicing factor CWC25-like protein [Senna tora]|uniref:Pre-mRNA-splicing factor CWC25-like protein n=1 Tax=Senna tora TaxID=362788 RepID=A0A834SDL4_9FABA|nr:pre-mRNA-splicing factor CWC25-like protein [Senna tora]